MDTHLNAYRRQFWMEQAIFAINQAIAACPTSTARNLATEAHILLLSARDLPQFNGEVQNTPGETS